MCLKLKIVTHAKGAKNRLRTLLSTGLKTVKKIKCLVQIVETYFQKYIYVIILWGKQKIGDRVYQISKCSGKRKGKVCPDCNQLFKTNFTLQRHMTTCKKGRKNIINCSKCGKIYSKKYFTASDHIIKCKRTILSLY